MALGARDVKRVAEFYSVVLRLAECRRFHTAAGELRSVWLGLGPGVLMVEKTSDVGRRIDGVGAGPFLLAVAWPEGLRHAEDWLAGQRIQIEARTEFTLYVRDPEGNRAAISVHPLETGG